MHIVGLPMNDHGKRLVNMIYYNKPVLAAFDEMRNYADDRWQKRSCSRGNIVSLAVDGQRY